MRAREIMTRNVLTLRPTASVHRAAELLASKGFSTLPVVDEAGTLVGMISEGDLVRHRFPKDAHYHTLADRAPDEPECTVHEVMSTPTVAVGPNTDIGVLAQAMLSKDRRCVPIVDGGRLVGVVTRQDIVRMLSRSDADIAADVRQRLELFGGAGRWTVVVRDGVAGIGDRYHDAIDKRVAEVLAESVPGVIRAVVHDQPAEPIPAGTDQP